MSPLFKACQKGNEHAVRELTQWNPFLGIGQVSYDNSKFLINRIRLII